MENYIKLQNILLNPNCNLEHFKQQLIQSEITQFTYICLLLNITATIKRPNFQFEIYLNLLIEYSHAQGHKNSIVNYTGYKDNVSILMNSCQKSVSSTVLVLANHPEIKLHLTDPNGLNAVFYAISNPDQNQGLKILQIFKDMSPSIFNHVTANGYTALFLAVQKVRIRMIEFLLQNEANPNKKLFQSGNTALHELVKYTSKFSEDEIKRIIETFIKYGFNLKIRNNSEKTFEEYALQFKLNWNDLLSQIKLNYEKVSQIDLNSSTDFLSSKEATTMTKIGEECTNYNISELEQSQFNGLDSRSVSNKSMSTDFNYIQRINLKYDQVFFIEKTINHSGNYQQNEDFLVTNTVIVSPRKISCYSDSRSKSKSESSREKQLINSQSSFSEDQQQEKNNNLDFLRVQQINYLKIHQQILDFSQFNENMYCSAWKQMQGFFHKLSTIVQSFGLYIEVIGSFANGLWTTQSDIDLALIEISDNYVDFEKLLEKVYLKLKFQMHGFGIRQINLNKSERMQCIKIDLDEYLYSSRKIDLMIFHKKNMASTYVNFIRESFNQYPQIRQIFFFMKKVCEQYGLHNPFNGGLKSYSIYLMILSMVRVLVYSNLGELLFKISYYYGFNHIYTYQLQNERPVMRLNIHDPLNMKNNMGGKNTDTFKVKNMFRSVYYGLHRNIKIGTSLQYILELATIL